MAQDSKVVNLRNQGVPQRFSMPAALGRLRDASGQSLKDVMSEFFDQADDALFGLADKASTNQDQTAYFDAMRELRLRRKTMTVSVLQYVSRAFNEIGQFQPGSNTGSLSDVDQDSLSLVDHSQLEQQVAIDNLVNKLRNQYADGIRLLNARVAHLVPSVDLLDSQMPLSPQVICNGLSEACTDLDIDIRSKLVVLKLFDRLLGGILGEFYKSANNTLVAEGVLPDMKRPPAPGKGRESSGSDTKQSATETGHQAEAYADPQNAVSGPPPHAESATHSPNVRATFSELSAMLHDGQSGGSGQPVGANRDNSVVIDTGTLMGRLNDIQAQSTGWDAGTVIPLSSQLQSVFRSADHQPLTAGQVDSDVINLVSMLFDFILEDRQLHSTMKAIISRLQIPVLKVALSDKNFFNRGGHPVRKLLNDLAMSAIGWSEKKPGQRDPLREKIELVVDRVLNEFTDNVDLFTELLNDFGHFMDLDRRRRELVEQRLRDAEEGRARQERASEATTALLSELRNGRDLPPSVSKLIDDALSKYLQWVVLRAGEDSDHWHKARRLTENLVWSVDPRPVTDQTRSELLKAIPGIVDGLRNALQEIAWDPFATDAAIRDLELAHVDAFQHLVTTARKEPVAESEASEIPTVHTTNAELDSVAKPVPSVVTPEPPASSPAAGSEPVSTAAEPVADAVAIASQWLDQADGLRVGSWVERTNNGNKARCKLAAFIKTTGKYIFVNRSGTKIAEYRRDELARAFEAEEISMLDDGLIFDRALESIIDNLRSNRKD